MTTETLIQNPTATTTEGELVSQPTDETSTTGALDEGQPQHEALGTEEGEGTKADEPKKAEGAPDEYEFTPGEGQEFDGKTIEHFSEVARELNLSQEAAQTLLSKMAPVMAERQAEQIAAVQAQWAEDSKGDKEFGGDKLTENLGLAKQAMDQYATPELRTLLNESGMGNHPEVIRLFVKVGKTISEDGFIPAGKPGASHDVKRLYPNSNMN